MVIRAAEPVVVDTGVVENRDQYLADVFSVVEPEDIRWVFISHDDIDHTGNLNALMELAPNATAIVNWFMVDRMGATLAVPPTRQRWIGDGESFEVGDRTLHAVRPPVFDSPTTRGLYDSKTGVYWSSDSFACADADPGRHGVGLRPGLLARGPAHLRPVRQPLARAGRRPPLPGAGRPRAGPRPDGDGRLPHAGDPRAGPGRTPPSPRRGSRPRPRSSPSPTRPSWTRSSSPSRASRLDRSGQLANRCVPTSSSPARSCTSDRRNGTRTTGAGATCSARPSRCSSSRAATSSKSARFA